MTSILQDIRFGLRLLRRQPTFTAIALVVLTIGIGVNTTAFSLVNALMLKPRIGGIDDRLTGLYSRDRTRPDDFRQFSWDELERLSAHPQLFRAVAGHSFGLVGLAEGDATRRVFTDIVTADYFETFGVAPIHGRGFTHEEARPGADVPVVIISHGLFQRMGGTADIVGRTVSINTRNFTIIGVAPAGFGGSMAMITPELWVPIGVYESVAFEERNEGVAQRLSDPKVRAFIVVARLADGMTITSIGPGLEAVSRELAAAEPESKDREVIAAPLSRMSVSDRPQDDDAILGLVATLLTLGGVVLLIASFNLANMLLARGRARSKEFAIRVAIGGGRARLTRQLVTESLMLAMGGAVGGLMLSLYITRFLLISMPDMLPISLAFDFTPDRRVLAATIGFATLAAIVFGLGPAWRLARTDAMPALKDQTDTRSGRAWLRWLTARDTLVMGQLALSFVMLTVAGLFVRGAIEAAKTDPGFTFERGIIANIDTTLVNYSPERSQDFFRTMLDDLRRLPGVSSASLASHMPFGEFENSEPVQLPGPRLFGADPAAVGKLFAATTASIGSDYFRTIGVPIRRGREFTATEATSAGGDRIAIIDETLARSLFGTDDPIGRSIQISPPDENVEPVQLRVVGVAGGIRASLFDEEPRAFLYQPFGQAPRSNMYLHAATSMPTADAETAMLPTVRQLVRSLEPRTPIVSLETRPMFQARNLLLAVLRTGATIFAAFGVAALLLSAAGVYGVKAYLVSRRTREIGVRMALGADGRDVVWMVLREGLTLVTIGLVVGAALSFLTGQVLRGMLFQGRALDLTIVSLAALTLVASVLLASWLPALRATRVAPTVALRAN